MVSKSSNPYRTACASAIAFLSLRVLLKPCHGRSLTFWQIALWVDRRLPPFWRSQCQRDTGVLEYIKALRIPLARSPFCGQCCPIDHGRSEPSVSSRSFSFFCRSLPNHALSNQLFLALPLSAADSTRTCSAITPSLVHAPHHGGQVESERVL